MRQWRRAAQDSATTAFLEVAADYTPAARLYGNFGIEIVARRAGYYTRTAHRVDALLMRAPLPFFD